MSKKNKRYITILDPVTLMGTDDKPARNSENEVIEQTHPHFIRDRTFDAAFVSDTPRDANTVHWTMTLVVARDDIRSAVRDLEPGDVLELDEDEWQLLKRATEKGNYGFGADACIPFMRAITGAPTEDPRKAKKAENGAKSKDLESGDSGKSLPEHVTEEDQAG